MNDSNLAIDVAPLLIFALAAVVFALGWLDTGSQLYLIAALLLGLLAAYAGYRLRKLYIHHR